MNNLSKTYQYLIIIIFLPIGLLTISLFMRPSMNLELSDHGQVLFSTAAKIGSKIGKKYRMHSLGGGGGAKPDGIWLIAISLEKSEAALTEKEARELIIQCMDDLLTIVNHDDQLKPFLKNYPFTAKNVELVIYSYDKNRSLYQFPSIAIVGNFEGKIGYFTEDPSTKHGYHTKKYETYEEAVAILSQNKE
ncbi:MAG: hypothetical protein ACH350_02315 [Parachlamydiaceae bacterium]